MEAEEPQIDEEDLKRENREKETLQQQLEAGKSAGGIIASMGRCNTVGEFLKFLNQDLQRRVEDRSYELYEESKDLYQSLTKDQALKHQFLSRCDFLVINNNHSRQSSNYNINSPLDLAKLILTTVKQEGKTLKSLMAYESFQSLEVRDNLHMMSKTYPLKIFSTETRARASQVLSIAIAAAHVDGNGWTESFFEYSFRKLEDFIQTLRPSDSRKAEILEEIEKGKKTGRRFSSVTADQVQQLLKWVITLESRVTELETNQNKRNNEEGRGEGFKRIKLNKDPNEFDNDGKSIESSDGTSGVGSDGISASQEFTLPYQVTAKPETIEMSSSEDHHVVFNIDLNAAGPGCGESYYFSVGSGECQPLRMQTAKFIGRLDLSGLEASTHQVKAFADKDGKRLLGQRNIVIEDMSEKVRGLAVQHKSVHHNERRVASSTLRD